MAQENVKNFMGKCLEDETLREQLKGKNADEVVAIAGSLGFTFTKDELEAFNRSIWKSTQELSPDEMEQASGGVVLKDNGKYWVIDDDYWFVLKRPQGDPFFTDPAKAQEFAREWYLSDKILTTDELFPDVVKKKASR